MLLGVERGLCVWITTLAPSVSQLSRQYGILNISQTYRPTWPVTGITLLFFFLPSKLGELSLFWYWFYKSSSFIGDHLASDALLNSAILYSASLGFLLNFPCTLRTSLFTCKWSEVSCHQFDRYKLSREMNSLYYEAVTVSEAKAVNSWIQFPRSSKLQKHEAHKTFVTIRQKYIKIDECFGDV
jgi:hypothetical protein